MKDGSDIDLLVEFAAGHVPGLIALAGMQNEFSAVRPPRGAERGLGTNT